jgi:inosine-uridine nucleoside N-ribohydrolase
MKKVIIDCDPGIDDALALIVAIRSRALEIKAITTVSGNLTADRCLKNVLKVFELLKVDSIPLGQGPLKPLIRDFPSDPFSHGIDGLGNTGLPEPTLQLPVHYAPDLIVDTVNRYPNEITLIVTAPLTNVALAMMKDPELPRKVKQLIIIGGAFGFDKSAALNATGDNPVSEWNIYVDPESAKLVFHAGFALTAIGLDVATHNDINYRDWDIERLKAATSPEAKFAVDLVEFSKGRGFGSWTTLIDSTAVVAAINPDLIKVKKIHVDIETQSELTRGQTVTDIRNNFRWTHLPAIEAAYEADFSVFHDFVVSTLTQ